MSMKKRKSSGQGGPAKSVKSETEEPSHAKQILQWLEDEVFPVGGPDKYLKEKYPDQASLLGFATWLEESFETDDRTSYSQGLRPGPHSLRLWMLSFRSDFGLPGFAEPEPLLTLVMLILKHGFKTDAEHLPGVEKLAVVAVDTSMLQDPYEELPPLEGYGDCLRPFSVAFCKGWRRTLSCMIICEGLRTLQIPFDQLPAVFKDSLRTVHGVVGRFSNMQDVVNNHRHVTMASTGTRRSAHCFNLLRQIEVLSKAGSLTFNDWEDSIKVARAFQIGAKEAGSITNLMCHISKKVVEELWESVRARGMRWITHEAIQNKLFNVGYTSGVGPWEAWKEHCCNKADDRLVECFVERMKVDWDRMGKGNKKPWNFRDGQILHATCGVFLTLTDDLEVQLPKQDWNECAPRLDQQFFSGFLDAELQRLLDSCVPPVPLSQVSFLRQIVAAVEQRQQREVEARNRELAAKVLQATFDQLVANIRQDIALLQTHLPNKETEALEASLDAKYLKDRQQKGQEWCANFMEQKCKLVTVDSNLTNALGGFAKFNHAIPTEGKTLVLALVDFTVFPSDATYVVACLDATKNLLTMTPDSLAHVQQPVVQSQTSGTAVLKNRRKVEDAFQNAKLDATTGVILLFDKSESRTQDARKNTQPALAVSDPAHAENAWHKSKVLENGTIGPASLITVANMLGYDRETTRPGAADRAEQKGLPVHREIVKAYLTGLELAPEDQIILVDICPNRHAEFARACLERALAEQKPPVYYYGMLRADQDDVKTSLCSLLYEHWDKSRDAPAKQRQRDPVEAPALVALSWKDGKVGFPDALLNKFTRGTAEHTKMLEWKMEVEAAFASNVPIAISQADMNAPPVSGLARQGSTLSHRSEAKVRAAGRPDWSIEDGQKPPNLEKVIHLEHVPAASFGLTRLASTAGGKNKPTIVVSSTYELWVGNETQDPIQLKGDLMGFHKGEFEERVVRGNAEEERNTLCFRALDDKFLVSHQKNIMSLADYMHFISATKGVAEVELLGHTLEQKVHPKAAAAGDAAADSDATVAQDPLPVPYRFTVSGNRACLHTVFKPASLGADDGQEKGVRAGSLGAIFVGQMDKLPRSDNAQVVWEVDLQTGAGLPVIVPLKPRFCLLGTLTLPAQTWVKRAVIA